MTFSNYQKQRPSKTWFKLTSYLLLWICSLWYYLFQEYLIWLIARLRSSNDKIYQRLFELKVDRNLFQIHISWGFSALLITLIYLLINDNFLESKMFVNIETRSWIFCNFYKHDNILYKNIKITVIIKNKNFYLIYIGHSIKHLVINILSMV